LLHLRLEGFHPLGEAVIMENYGSPEIFGVANNALFAPLREFRFQPDTRCTWKARTSSNSKFVGGERPK